MSSASVVYEPITADGEASGLMLSVLTGSKVRITDEDGIRTDFAVTTTPTTTRAAVFRADLVHDPVIAQTTNYAYDSAGRVARITAGLPDGIAAGTCDGGAAAAGCRSLIFTYATATTATSSTPGDFKDRVKQISARVHTGSPVVLASYAYDSAGRMVRQTDVLTGLVTEYGWTTSGGAPGQALLSRVKQPGVTAVEYSYDAAAKLSKVERTLVDSSQKAQLTAIVYDPQQGTAAVPQRSGLQAVLSQFGPYQLPRTATRGFAVFGPDAPITGIPAAGSQLWLKADVWLTDDDGYTVHEARYGAGEWQLSAHVYDAHDNVISSWDTRATKAIRDGVVSDIEAAATQTVFNAEIKNAAGEVITPAGTLVTDVYSPAAMLRNANGELTMLRRHVRTLYDQGAPNSGINPVTNAPYRLSTKVVVTSEHPDKTLDRVLTTTWSGYEPVVAGDKSGWELGQATSSTLDMNSNDQIDGADLTSRTRYDGRGRIIEERKPGSSGGDASTRSTVYWSAGANARDAACGNKPEWAGFICKTGPISQPGGTNVPVSVTSDYRWDGQPAKETETSGSASRTITKTFDAKGRLSTTAVAVAGVSGSTAVPTTTTTYHEPTGQVAGTSSSAGTTAFTYDAWGRETSYTNHPAGQSADVTTTEYNSLGDVAKVITPQTVTQFTYDGPDANGQTEHRGLLTKVVSTIGGRSLTAAGAYDAHGELVTEKLPGGVIRREDYDLTGELVSVAYNGTVTDPDTGQPVLDQPWVAWSLETNASGLIEREYTPGGAGAGYGDLPGESAVIADMTYSYDQAGRLVQVADRTRTPDQDEACQVRGYGFDQRGNRTSQSLAAGSTCQNTQPISQVQRSYDAFDRILTGAGGSGSYTYDALGRQLTIPATDAPDSAEGNITLGYYHDDSARTITQGGTTLTYTLDDAGRRVTESRSVNGSLKGWTTNHYRDSGDNPAWVDTMTADQDTRVVYSDLVSDDLSVSVTTGTGLTPAVEVTLLTPRGDVAATITVPESGAAAGLDSYTHYTEYGIPVTAQPQGNTGASASGYGWLGAHQRSTTEIGILLMGSRLYNPDTGLFTSIDPVWGGNDTIYGYPNDPINKQDTTGEKWWNKLAGAASVISAGACVLGGPAVCLASTAVAVVASGYARYRNGERGAQLALGIAADSLGLFVKPVRWAKSLKNTPRRAGGSSVSRTSKPKRALTNRWTKRQVYQPKHGPTGSAWRISSYSRAANRAPYKTAVRVGVSISSVVSGEKYLRRR